MDCIAGTLSNQDVRKDQTDLNNAIDVTISPDGKHAYVAAYGNNALVYFNRNLNNGGLTNFHHT